MTTTTATPVAAPAPDHARRPLPVLAAASIRSVRTVGRIPALLISPLGMSLFFMLIYSGQLAGVGGSYLGQTSFITFLLPLILLTGAVTAAATAGELVVRDAAGGYLDRLGIAHGSSVPFLIGPLAATALVIIGQAALTILGAVALGYRPGGVGSVAALVALALAIGLGVALFSVAVALRFATSAAVNGVTTLFFGLSFFTGVLAPADQLSGWLRAVAQVNPMTYLLEAMRSVEGAATTHSPTLAALFFALLFVGGVVACMLSLRKRSALR